MFAVFAFQIIFTFANILLCTLDNFSVILENLGSWSTTCGSSASSKKYATDVSQITRSVVRSWFCSGIQKWIIFVGYWVCLSTSETIPWCQNENIPFVLQYSLTHVPGFILILKSVTGIIPIDTDNFCWISNALFLGTYCLSKTFYVGISIQPILHSNLDITCSKGGKSTYFRGAPTFLVEFVLYN